MMQTERTRSTQVPVTLAEIEAHLRTPSGYEPAVMFMMAQAAVAEIEERAGLAILSQTVTITTGTDWCADIPLSVGPVASGAVATVSTLGEDGTLTPVASGFWLEAGRWPVLHVTDTTITGRLVISYTAGLAATTSAVPADVRHAVCDQVARMYDYRGEGAPALSGVASQLIARRGRVRL
jgi:uncharacterized phiE125 gp8 family phage protein